MRKDGVIMKKFIVNCNNNFTFIENKVVRYIFGISVLMFIMCWMIIDRFVVALKSACISFAKEWTR